MSQAHSFPAVSTPEARVLILGSMPGLPSLAANQYYGNPHNAFWRIMAAMFDFDPDAPYEIRLRTLKDNKVALWDVIASCYRKGSLDSAIRSDSVEVNAFAEFFRRHNHIAMVFFNGGKAEQLWNRHVAPDLTATPGKILFRRLPSTSPAHAAMPYEKKLEQWLEIQRAVRLRR